MSNVAGVALLTAAAFLFVVAILLNSPALFYMSTAMIATIAAARWQAWVATKQLEFHRRTPAATHVGEWVNVELEVTSQMRMRRPLIRILDLIPERLFNESVSPSTPIAPAYGSKVISRYQVRPERRGIYRWSKVRVVGHDALGIVTVFRDYPANMVELVVYPAQIPVQFDFANAFGWGNSETDHGLGRGSGIEPRGTREYVFGDSMRYVHWRSSARSNQLIVKEFETGSHASAAFFIQDSNGSEVGEGARTTTELMCGHLAYILSRGLRQGVSVFFPALEPPPKTALPQERELEVLAMLARLQANSDVSVSQSMAIHRGDLTAGTAVYVMVAVQDPELPAVIENFVRGGHSVTVLLYDASTFVPSPKTGMKILGGAMQFDLRTKNQSLVAPVHSAAEASYVARLRNSGAQIRTMPLDGLKQEKAVVENGLSPREAMLMAGGAK